MFYNHFKELTDQWKEKYKNLFGKRIKSDNIIFEFVSCNDLGVPYFAKVTGNKTGKKLYTVLGYDQSWAMKQLEV